VTAAKGGATETGKKGKRGEEEEYAKFPFAEPL